MEGGAWGIVIIISAFMIQFITFGISCSVGIYTVEFLTYFDTTAFDVSLVSSINLGIFLGTGPIAGYFMDKYNHRTVVFVGGVMSSVGILVMPWLPSIPYMYLFYGVINGLGGCLSYVPSHVLSGLYYDKYQGLSTGIATSGSGLGITVGPIIVAYLIEEYTWKGSLLILSGVCFNVLVFAALLRPPPPRKITETIPALPTVTSEVPFDSIVPKERTTEEKIKYVENGACVGCGTNNDCSESTIEITDAVTKSNNYPKSYLHKICKNVLTNVDFVIYFINNIFWNFGLAVPLAFLAEYCVQHGISKIDSAMIVTIVGLGNFLGCLIGSVMSSIRQLGSFRAFCIINILSGVFLILITTTSEFSAITCFSFFFGLFTGTILGYLLAITGEILGPDDFGDGVAVLMIANGIGAFSGPLITGYLAKGDGRISYGFLVGGSFCILAGLIIVLIPLRQYLARTEGTDNIAKGKPEVLQMGPLKDATSGPLPTLVIPTITVDDVSDGKDIDDDAPHSSLRKNSFFKPVTLDDEK